MTRIFITGGSGSLGKALIGHLQETDDITVYSRDEWKQSQLRREYPDVRFMLGDVRDYDRLLLAMRGHETVIHAAAYKQVPSAEANVDEAIHTNVLGSLNVARAAVHNNVSNVVGISTDKACAPINAYGQTKALMEKLFQQAEDWSDTFFNCVRYGNVLNSRGSVVPLFREQIDAGHLYTLTDPAMTRFWMTLDDAVEAVLTCVNPRSLELVEAGAVLVPLCSASTMLDLLHAVHNVYGGGEHDEEPFDDRHYVVTGVRPGEKIHECLLHANESEHSITKDDLPDYFQILPSDTDMRHEPFTYYSNNAPQLTVKQLEEMLLSGVITDDE